MTAAEQTFVEAPTLVDGVLLTDVAAGKVKALLESEGREDLALRVAVQRVLDQSAHVFLAKRREGDVLHERAARAADLLESAHEGMGARNLVVPVRADQQDVPHVRLDH